MDVGQIAAMVMIDLSKAFDTINHNLLLRKLSTYGVCEKELLWFTDYLAGRKQRVVVDGVSSEWANMHIYGCSQGSILGPLLFLNFVNDLPDAVEECSTNLYADDTTIYSAARCRSCMQYLVLEWRVTQLMVLSRKGKRACGDTDSAQVKVEDVELKKQDCVRYLGVEIDKDFLHGSLILRRCINSVWASWQ